jgi:hypothetical protein
MELKEAQAKLVAAIKNDPESVIAHAIRFKKSAADIADDVRKANGPLQGVAAATVQYALQGRDAEQSVANLIRFAELL